MSGKAKKLSLNVERDIVYSEEVEEVEADLYLARHNAMIYVLGEATDATLEGRRFDRTRLMMGLMFEAWFCHAISGNHAIRGIIPKIPGWHSTIQAVAGDSSSEALDRLVDCNRKSEYMLASNRVDARMDDVALARSTSWMSKLGGSKRAGPGDWWDDQAPSPAYLDGPLAECGRAAELYLGLERFNVEDDHRDQARSPEMLETVGHLISRTKVVRTLADNLRSQLRCNVSASERRLVGVYACLYPDEVRRMHIPPEELDPLTVKGVRRVSEMLLLAPREKTGD